MCSWVRANLYSMRKAFTIFNAVVGGLEHSQNHSLKVSHSQRLTSEEMKRWAKEHSYWTEEDAPLYLEVCLEYKDVVDSC